MGPRTKRLLFEIEIAKQRLQYAIDSQRDTLAFETQRQLANLNAMLVAELSALPVGAAPIKRPVFWLVFSEAFQDGIVLSSPSYRALTRTMNADDRACHVALEIEGPIEADLVEQSIALDATDRRINKSAS